MQLTLQRDTNYLDPVLSGQFAQISIPLLHYKSNEDFYKIYIFLNQPYLMML